MELPLPDFSKSSSSSSGTLSAFTALDTNARLMCSLMSFKIRDPFSATHNDTGKNAVSSGYTTILSLWCSGSMQDSQLGMPGSLPDHGSHCMIEAGEMCKLTVVLTSGRLVH